MMYALASVLLDAKVEVVNILQKSTCDLAQRGLLT
jgi:hypothetical protein